MFWTNDTGMTADFMWMNGGSDNGFFGDPTIVGNTFVFTPSGFRADSADGVSDMISDRLEVDLLARGAFHFTDIVVSEFGDYSIVNTGTVSVTTGLFVTRTNGSFAVANGGFTQEFNSGAGNWSDAAFADLDGTDNSEVWTAITIVLNNNLSATTGAESTAFIEKKVAGVSIEIVPTPGTSALMAMAGLVAFRRKR